MIHESGSSPSCEQNRRELWGSVRKWKVFKGRARWGKEVKNKGRIISSKITFLWEEGRDLSCRQTSLALIGSFQIDWLKDTFPGELKPEWSLGLLLWGQETPFQACCSFCNKQKDCGLGWQCCLLPATQEYQTHTPTASGTPWPPGSAPSSGDDKRKGMCPPSDR